MIQFMNRPVFLKTLLKIFKLFRFEQIIGTKSSRLTWEQKLEPSLRLSLMHVGHRNFDSWPQPIVSHKTSACFASELVVVSVSDIIPGDEGKFFYYLFYLFMK